MFKPSTEKSNKTRAMIQQVFTSKIGENSPYTIAYAYFMKSGLFSKKMYSYVVGFSSADKSVVIIPLDTNGNSGDAVVLKKEDIASVKKGMQGDFVVKTNRAKEEYRFFVPPYTASTLESAYVLPVIQEEEAAQFINFVKGNF